jgi:3-oxoacyl-[acyl-carrier-protein] synthase-3
LGYAYISGTGYYVPEWTLPTAAFDGLDAYYYDNQDDRILQDGRPKGRKISADWVKKNMGALQRRYAAEDEKVYHLGAKAAKEALKASGEVSLDGIIFATATQDKRFPSAAHEVQDILGLQGLTHVYDLQAACSGFNSALYQASLLARADPGSSYLVIGAEILSRHLRDDDINIPLFGDGAGAAVVSHTTERKGILSYHGGSDPSGGRKSWIYHTEGGFLSMPNGKDVMKEAIRNMTASATQVMEDLDWKKEEILLIPHQANIYIIRGVASRLGLEEEQVHINIHKYANMSSATYAVGLAESVAQGKIGSGSKVILSSIGSGLIWASVGILF